MKNRLCKLILFGCCVCLIAACGSSRKATSVISGVQTNEVEMIVYPERNGGAPETVKLTITNNSVKVIQFGANYSIERLVDGKWQVHDIGNFPVIMIMYSLAPKESATYDINLFPEKAKYIEGDYRVVKQIGDENGNKSYYANFKIIEPR